MNTLRKTPINYYGGKQTLAPLIISLIPAHRLYVEPFFGGGAVFFAKDKSRAEVINDTNLLLVNFYQVCQDKDLFTALKARVKNTYYSRYTLYKSTLILKNPSLFDAVERAHALWYSCNGSINARLDGGFRYTKTGNESVKFFNKREHFGDWLFERLARVEIDTLDVLEVIKWRDTSETFYYLDPPYIGANQGHYRGYTNDDFNRLLAVLPSVKGRFLMSCYMTGSLRGLIKDSGWYLREKRMALSTSQVKGRTKVECLVANYDISEQTDGD